MTSQPHRAGLSPHCTVALDGARALAAVYVVIHHLAFARGWSWNSGFGFLFKFGQEAVIVFFLLSGFVIFSNEAQRAQDSAGYFIRRLRRIYPPLIVALVVSTLVFWDNGTLAERFRLDRLVGTLLSLQDTSLFKPGVITDPFLGNDPLWSISYEVAFYAAFPLVLRLWLRWPQASTHLIGASCFLAYLMFALHPNHWLLVWAYFLIWWTGAMLAHAYHQGRRSILDTGPAVPWLAALVATAAAVAWRIGWSDFARYPVLPTRHFAVALALALLFFDPLGAIISRHVAPFARPAKWIALVSYGIYVFHFPLLIQWRRSASLEGLAAAIVVLIALAYLFDYRLNIKLAQVSRAKARAAIAMKGG